MKKMLAIGFIFILIFVFVGFYLGRRMQSKETIIKDIIINSVTFNCLEGKSIQALFFKDKVELNLSDKRSMLLLQAVSASGVRYTNSDESFVFWNKGNTAFVEENKNFTFKDCVIK